jgi:hypothetical protein
MSTRTFGEEPRRPGQWADLAAEAIRELNHRTLPATGELAEPGDVDEILAALATLTARLPQLLDQLSGWLLDQHRAGRLRVDLLAPTPDAGGAVQATVTALENAADASRQAGRAIGAAHQHTAHIAYTRDFCLSLGADELAERPTTRWRRPGM